MCIESVLTFVMICGFGNLSVKNKTLLGKFVNVCRKVTAVNVNDLCHLYQVRATQKAQVIILDSQHPLHREFDLLPSRRRFYHPRGSTNRYMRSFIPSAIWPFKLNGIWPVTVCGCDMVGYPAFSVFLSFLLLLLMVLETVDNDSSDVGANCVLVFMHAELPTFQKTLE